MAEDRAADVRDARVQARDDARAQAQELAFDLARRWLDNNYAAFQQSNPNAMFEKVLKLVS